MNGDASSLKSFKSKEFPSISEGTKGRGGIDKETTNKHISYEQYYL